MEEEEEERPPTTSCPNFVNIAVRRMLAIAIRSFANDPDCTLPRSVRRLPRKRSGGTMRMESRSSRCSGIPSRMRPYCGTHPQQSRRCCHRLPLQLLRSDTYIYSVPDAVNRFLFILYECTARGKLQIAMYRALLYYGTVLELTSISLLDVHAISNAEERERERKLHFCTGET